MERPSRIRSKSKSSNKSSRSNKHLESEIPEHLSTLDMVEGENRSMGGTERELTPCSDNDAIQPSKNTLGENASFEFNQAEDKGTPPRKDSPSSERPIKKSRRQSSKSSKPEELDDGKVSKDCSQTEKKKKSAKPNEGAMAECKSQVANGEDETFKGDSKTEKRKKSVSKRKKTMANGRKQSKDGTTKAEDPENDTENKMAPQKDDGPKKRKIKRSSEVGIKCKKGNKSDKTSDHFYQSVTEENECQKKDIKKEKARPLPQPKISTTDDNGNIQKERRDIKKENTRTLPQPKNSTIDDNGKIQKEKRDGEHREKRKVTKDRKDRGQGGKSKITKVRKEEDQERSKVSKENENGEHREANKMSKNKDGEHRIDSKVSKSKKDGEFREKSQVIKDRRPESNLNKDISEERAGVPVETSKENGQQSGPRKGGKSRGHKNPEDSRYRKTKKAKGTKRSKKTLSEETVSTSNGDLKDLEHGEVENKEQLIQNVTETENVESYGIEGVDYNIVNGVIIPKLDLSFLDDSPSSSPTVVLSLISFSSPEPEEPQPEVLTFKKKVRRRWQSFKKSIASCCCITYEEE